MTTSHFERGYVVAIDNIKEDSGSMRVRVMDVAPELAQEFLNALAPYQRRLDDKHVAHLEADMRAGRWTPNGSPIRFDVLGRLCDGQHRLTACVLAGFTLRQCVVVYQLPVEANATIDTTAKTRSAMDVARQHQFAVIPNTSTLAGVALEHYGFDVSRMQDHCTSTQRVELWAGLPADMQEAVRKLDITARAKHVSNRGTLAACLRCMRTDDRAQAFLTLSLSNHVDASIAGRVLFNTLTRSHGRVHVELDNAWAVMRAFVAFIRGERIQVLRGAPTDWPVEARTIAAVSRRTQ